MQTIEYELTYLAKELPPELHQALPTRMVDIYIPGDMAVHPVVRLRKKGNAYEITKKQEVSSNDYSTMTEQTIPLSKAEFEALASGNNRMVEKDRYNVILDGYPAEIDVFSGELDGLILIDFEFFNEAAKSEFKAPACCLADVTQEEFVAGGMLAGRKYDDIAQNLENFNYKKLQLS
jgi:CYTH domain-containing protein